MPIRSGEDLTAFENRLREDWERSLPKPKAVGEMTDSERAVALAEISRPAPRSVVAPFEGKHIDHLSPHERAEAARQLGIAHVFPSFR